MERTTWSSQDDSAVTIARALAMDSVQKVGNGHPGTAMSLAPVAYTLFQRFLRHDPNDSTWLGRDRFVLSCGHSSLTLYIHSSYRVMDFHSTISSHFVPITLLLQDTRSTVTPTAWRPQLVH